MRQTTLPNRLFPFLLHFLWQFRWGCAGLVVFPVLGRAVVASIAYASKWLTDTALSLPHASASLHALIAPFALFAALVISRFGLDALMWWSSYHTRSPMLARMKEEVFAYAQRLSPSYFESTLSGKIAHRSVMLPDQTLMLFDMAVFDFIPGGMFFVFVAIYLYLASPIFGVLATACLAVYFTLSLWLGQECARRSAGYNDARATVTGRVVDVITNIRNVFFFANQSIEDRELCGFTAEERRRRMSLYVSVVRLRCVQYGLDIVMWIGFVAAALNAWVHGTMSAGSFVMVTQLIGSLLQTAYNVGQRIPEFYDQLGGAQESLQTLIVPATVPDPPGAPPLRVSSGEIRFSRVAFAYSVPGREVRNIVHDFELTIPGGQRVGLIGESGAGKSTLLALLMRLHDVTGGAIRIDGQDLRQVSLDSLRGAVGLIPQDTSLFHRTLMENIRYGRPGATDEEVVRAARRAHAHDFIMELEHGYQTLVGERGLKISGGQRQRIAIARAILRDAPVLLLDEATSALDSHSEQLIQEAMREAMRGKTVIAIAHRLSTVMDMDRLIVLSRGRIIADGTHSQLLRQGGVYAELWRKQSGGFNPVARRPPVQESSELAEAEADFEQAPGGPPKEGMLSAEAGS